MNKVIKRLIIPALAGATMVMFSAGLNAADYDIVIKNGRVMNPASGLDSVRHVGIRNGKIAILSRETINGEVEVDASGLVVAPGFIDLHAHGQREFEARLQAQDGVTTQLELEAGIYPIEAWYTLREGTAPINFGASVGHISTRIASMLDLESLGLSEDELSRSLEGEVLSVVSRHRQWMDDAASAEQLAEIQRRIQEGLDEGALGIGYGINYTAGATREEIIRVFGLAGKNSVTNFVHSRFMGNAELGGSVDAIQELIADTAISGSSLHIMHIGSSGGNQVPLLLEMIDHARANGMDISTEVYPYTAWSTFIGASIFTEDFTKTVGIDYSDIELPETGERLNEESFWRIRRESPATIIVGHGMKDVNVTAAIAHPGVMIGSDGMIYHNGRAHPRGAGTFSRVLGRYVREQGALTLMEALGKMSYLPAKRLESFVPQMKHKGRISVGADADIVIFDAATVIDRATFTEPALPSTGISHVLVNGTFVVRNGELLEGAYPGQAIRR